MNGMLFVGFMEAVRGAFIELIDVGEGANLFYLWNLFTLPVS